MASWISVIEEYYPGQGRHRVGRIELRDDTDQTNTEIGRLSLNGRLWESLVVVLEGNDLLPEMVKNLLESEE